MLEVIESLLHFISAMNHRLVLQLGKSSFVAWSRYAAILSTTGLTAALLDDGVSPLLMAR